MKPMQTSSNVRKDHDTKTPTGLFTATATATADVPSPAKRQRQGSSARVRGHAHRPVGSIAATRSDVFIHTTSVKPTQDTANASVPAQVPPWMDGLTAPPGSMQVIVGDETLYTNPPVSFEACQRLADKIIRWLLGP